VLAGGAKYRKVKTGPRFILTPGCSVPNESTGDKLARLPQVLGA
jgi:hypothetical protein